MAKIDDDLLEELAERLFASSKMHDKARRQLEDMQPGFPASTPGASAGSGSVPLDDIVALAPTQPARVHALAGRLPATTPISGHVAAPKRASVVEQLAGQPDEARAAKKRLAELDNIILKAVTEHYSLVHIWGRDPARPKIDPDEDHEWCTNHLRVEICEPVDLKHYPGLRLCNWCGIFRSKQGRLPSAGLLRKKHDGIRITANVIAADHPVRRRTKTKKVKR